MVQHYVMTGWPKYAVKVPDNVKAYYASRHYLTTPNGLILYNGRIVVPHKLRPEILQRIHNGHQGIVKCREHARCSVWWLRIGKDIQKIVSTCKHCQESRPTQKREPLITTPLPSHTCERVAADICELNKHNYLVVVGYFSRYIEIAYLKDMPGETIRAKLRNIQYLQNGDVQMN